MLQMLQIWMLFDDHMSLSARGLGGAAELSTTTHFKPRMESADLSNSLMPKKTKTSYASLGGVF